METSNSPGQARYTSPYYPLPHSHSPVSYSPPYAPDMDSNRDYALSSAHDKLRIEQVNHDKIVEALRNQVNSLRQQLDLSEKVNQAEVAKARDGAEDRLTRLLREKEDKLTFIATKSNDLQRQLDAEIEKNSTLRQEILTMKLRHSEETGKLEGQIRALKQELEFLRNSSLAKAEGDLMRLKGDLTHKEAEMNRVSNKMQEEAEALQRELLGQVRAKDEAIHELQRELREVKALEFNRKSYQERDLEVLQNTINSSKKVIGLYEVEIERLKNSRDEAKKDAVKANKEAAVAEMETARLRAKNEQLESQIEKMQRLISTKS